MVFEDPETHLEVLQRVYQSQRSSKMIKKTKEGQKRTRDVLQKDSGEPQLVEATLVAGKLRRMDVWGEQA